MIPVLVSLAKLMHLMSAFYARVGIGRFEIVANDKCIGLHRMLAELPGWD